MPAAPSAPDTRLGRITVVTPNYPRAGEAERGAFVERLVAQWEEAGVATGVIAPLPVFSASRTVDPAAPVPVIAGSPLAYPRYLSLSARRIGPLDLKRWSQLNFCLAAQRAQRQQPIPDAYYGKFLLSGTAAAARLGRRYHRPVFADLGESTLLAGLTPVERQRAATLLQSCAGVVCVSPRLIEEARELGVEEQRLLLAPNEADPRRFHPLDRQDCRRRLGLPAGDFIVVFVGHFIERKGPLRVLEAINRAGGRVKGIFLGRGAQHPAGDRVLRAAPVPNEDLPLWLNAADVLVLPTLAEGCCNAIVEAVACGLPIITSDIDDVRWQLPAGVGHLVDPHDVEAIADRIRACEAMSPEAPSTSAREEMARAGTDRASRILEWLQQRAGEHRVS